MTARPSLASVVAGGDRRASLVTIRDRLAVALSSARGGPAAILARELRDVIRELDSMPPVDGVRTPLDRIAGTITDDLAVRRADRGAGAAGS